MKRRASCGNGKMREAGPDSTFTADKLGLEAGNLVAGLFVVGKGSAIPFLYPLGEVTGIPPNNPATEEAKDNKDRPSDREGEAPIEEVGFSGGSEERFHRSERVWSGIGPG